jgi:hypothetical protein
MSSRGSEPQQRPTLGAQLDCWDHAETKSAANLARALAGEYENHRVTWARTQALALPWLRESQV